MDEQRAEFEAWASHFFTRGELDRNGINGARPDEYRVLHIERMWGAWQAATQRQQERIAYVEKIAEDAIELCTQQANRVMELEAQVQALNREAVVLAEKAEMHDAINRACAELPEGYDLHIELEKNAGTVRLYLLDSDADVTDFGSDLGFVGEINASIDAAIAAGKGEVNG